mmetsp:Transcript_437/g.1379  ORF Transcript_437/g.1379 Transcript_437/m.1379 type:complete len:209 (+) Transcript_437:212-838(+)
MSSSRAEQQRSHRTWLSRQTGVSLGCAQAGFAPPCLARLIRCCLRSPLAPMERATSGRCAPGRELSTRGTSGSAELGFTFRMRCLYRLTGSDRCSRRSLSLLPRRFLSRRCFRCRAVRSSLKPHSALMAPSSLLALSSPVWFARADSRALVSGGSVHHVFAGSPRPSSLRLGLSSANREDELLLPSAATCGCRGISPRPGDVALAAPI